MRSPHPRYLGSRCRLAAAVAAGGLLLPAPAVADVTAVSNDGISLEVGSVIVVGVEREDLCHFGSTGFSIRGNTSVTAVVTPSCTLVVTSVDEVTPEASERQAPRGAVTPRRDHRSQTGAGPNGVGVVRLGGLLDGVALPDPALSLRRGWVRNTVHDESRSQVFTSYDHVDFTRNLRDGTLGPLTHSGDCEAFQTLWVAGAPSPFVNSITVCEYEKWTETADEISVLAQSGYHRGTPPVDRFVTSFSRVTFTVENFFDARPDDDGNLRNDHEVGCPLVEAGVPKSWLLTCTGGEVDLDVL